MRAALAMLLGMVWAGGAAASCVHVVRHNEARDDALAFTASVGTLTHGGLYDAVAGGNALAWGTLGTPAPLNAAGTVTIPAESLTILAD